jgi:ribosomal protein S18 acetylase RimI-like enzyme
MERKIMNCTVRDFSRDDIDDIVRLSLMAWEPVFNSFEVILGPRIYPFLYPDWHKSQAEGVEKYCMDIKSARVLVAEVEGRVVGFIAYENHEDDKTGEVMLLAVHPQYQNQGIGTDLNIAALDEMKASGMEMAVVGTGGDPAHGPARRSYQKAGYTGLPLVRYYKAL